MAIHAGNGAVGRQNGVVEQHLPQRSGIFRFIFAVKTGDDHRRNKKKKNFFHKTPQRYGFAELVESVELVELVLQLQESGHNEQVPGGTICKICKIW